VQKIYYQQVFHLFSAGYSGIQTLINAASTPPLPSAEGLGPQ